MMMGDKRQLFTEIMATFTSTSCLNGFSKIHRNYASTLSEGFSRIRENETFSDITLLVDGKRFNAHKVILSAVSPYFEAMLCSGMKESQQNEIEVKNVSSKTMEKLLDFAYTGKLLYSGDEVQDLLFAADYLGISVIRDDCSSYIINHMNSKNIVEIYQLADQICDEKVRKSAVDYFVKNFASFSKSEVFSDVPVSLLKQALNSEKLSFLTSNNIPFPGNQEKEILRSVLKYVSHDKAKRLPELPELLSLVRLPVILPTELRKLRKDTKVKESAESVKVVKKALKVSPEYNLALQVEQWRKPRNNQSLETMCSRFFLDTGPFAHSITERYDDFTAVTKNAYVTGMKIWLTKCDNHYVWGGYQTTFSSGQKIHHGGKNYQDGKTHQFQLKTGEVITSLEIVYDTSVNQITFTTNTGKKLGPYGTNAGRSRTSTHKMIDQNAGYLVCTEGRLTKAYGKLTIAGLRFHWAYCKVPGVAEKYESDSSSWDEDDSEMGSDDSVWGYPYDHEDYDQWNTDSDSLEEDDD